MHRHYLRLDGFRRLPVVGGSPLLGPVRPAVLPVEEADATDALRVGGRDAPPGLRAVPGEHKRRADVRVAVRARSRRAPLADRPAGFVADERDRSRLGVAGDLAAYRVG